MYKSKWSKIIIGCLLFLFVFNVFSQKSYAKTGDFYKQHKTAIEKTIILQADRDFVKKYDYNTNSFECGTFDIMCMYRSTQYTAIIGTIKVTYSGLKSTIINPSDITGNSTFKKYKNGFSTLSTTMLAIFLMWQMIRIVAQRFADADDGMVAINDKLLTVVTSAILLAIYDNFFTWILQFQSMAVKAILSDTIKTDDIVLMIFVNGRQYGELVIFLIMIAIFIFAIVFAYRFILFGFLYITGVLAIPTAVNDEYNYFSLWLKLIINNGVTLFLQVLAFSLGLNSLIKANMFNIGTNFTVSMGFFMLAVAIPSLLGQLGGSSGTSRAIGSTASYVARRR